MVWDLDKVSLKLEQGFLRFDLAEMSFVKPLAELLQKDPDKAIDLIVDTYNKALDDSYTNSDGENVRSYIEAFAGGPYQKIPWALYNAVGTVYPFLERQQKDKALTKILNILDNMNCGDVNGSRGLGHTTHIGEPLLLSDISIARPIYWPGLGNGRHILRNYGNFFDFQKDHVDENGFFKHEGVFINNTTKVKVESDFIVAYSLLRSDLCDWGENYTKIADPDFLQRTMQGIVATRFYYWPKPEDIEKGQKRLRELLPKSLHDKIEPLRKEQDWADYAKFK